MASIARLALENAEGWNDIAARVDAWACAQPVDLRDVVMLVPFAQLLPLARRAFAHRGGWQPRIETTRTLSASFGPPPKGGEDQISFDLSTDRLHAARLLREQSWVPREPLAFDDAVAAVVVTAHALLKAASALAPESRESHWARGRELLTAAAAMRGGVGTMERGLARVALEWAASASPPATDALWAYRPRAWVVIQAGGEDRLAATLLDTCSSDVPCLLIDADQSLRNASPHPVSLAVCEGFEHEAQCAAAEVLAHVRQGKLPVALVSQDRLLVRRVRALLGRHAVSLQDETGWTLSTTHAAARVMALLRAAPPEPGTDAVLDWLKTTAWPQPVVAQIESACRREGWVQRGAIRAESLPSASASDLWTEAAALLQSFAALRRRPLAEWLLVLRRALLASGVLSQLAADEAGSQLLRALRIEQDQRWLGMAAQTAMNFQEFMGWVDTALEDAAFIPEAVPDASVVVTPLARLMLRPFAAIVFPGADDRHLGADAGPHALLSESQALAFGVPTARQRRQMEMLAFSHAVARAPVSFFHRRADGSEPLALSPLVEQLSLRLSAVGRSFAPWMDPRPMLLIEPSPVTMPAPSAQALLPERLSASACEALRACPYRFHALYLLRLREAQELDDEVEQRDYGTWLHAVLLKFHEQRGAPAPAEAEGARLLAIARQEKAAQGLNDADFLPYEAGFADLVPRYIAWLHERDAQGASFRLGEEEREVAPAAWAGTRLYGRIDRMDDVQRADGPALELIDYKTGNALGLRDKLRQPHEDTQLAVYAALVQPQADRPIEAGYLTLSRKIEFLPHPAVEESARALVAGIGENLARLRGGAGLPALGEPPTCDFCEARGLCRRDHWSGA